MADISAHSIDPAQMAGMNMDHCNMPGMKMDGNRMQSGPEVPSRGTTAPHKMPTMEEQMKMDPNMKM
jgi:hypothetical protein